MSTSSSPRFGVSSVCAAFAASSVGTRVLSPGDFYGFLGEAVSAHDFARDRVPGQGFIPLPPEAYATVSGGVGRRRPDSVDYVLATHRGRTGAYLHRRHAAPVEGLAVVVYTLAAYAADPEVEASEIDAFRAQGVTHAVVAVLASAGPRPPLSPERLLSNLAGGNREALVWSADEIRAKATEVLAYDADWCVVSD
jgi:hypothetical protein